jgi:lipopolysaccharide/colanic/teichoic acid biosynthesis glycosyltransferase
MALRLVTRVDKPKLGIIGWAQINGRDYISIKELAAFKAAEVGYNRSL